MGSRTRIVRHFTKERSLQTDWKSNKEQIKHYELVTVFYYPLTREGLEFDDFKIRKMLKEKNLFGDNVSNIDVNTKYRLIPHPTLKGKQRREVRKIVIIRYGEKDKIATDLTVVDAHRAIIQLMAPMFGMVVSRLVFVGTRGRYSSTKARVLKKPRKSRLTADKRGAVK